MKTILGMSIAAGFLLAASAAYAADDQECIGGYRLIAGTPIACDDGYTPMLSSSPPPVEEPLYTGSISAPAEVHGMMMVSGPQECRPGAFWLMENPNQDTPIACPGT